MSLAPDQAAGPDWEALRQSAATFGVQLAPEQIAALQRYLELLVEWNQRLNLTAITRPQEILTKHFLDSLTCAQAVDLRQVGSVVDVGTGAGFPGIVLKIAFPHLQLTLLDSVARRLSFLDRVAIELGLDQVRIIHARAEDATSLHPAGPVALVGRSDATPSRPFRLRESFDLVTARAVAPLAVLAEWTLPFANVGGCVLAMKGPSISIETDEAREAVRLLGGGAPVAQVFTLPGTDIGRSLVRIPKVRATPPHLPRLPGAARKEPLTAQVEKSAKPLKTERRQSRLAARRTSGKPAKRKDQPNP